MKLKKGLIVSFMVLLITIVGFSTSVFAANIGEQVNSPEQGWQRIDDTNTNLVYNGTWDIGVGSECLNGTDHYSLTLNSSLKFKFQGTKFRVYTVSYHSRNIPIDVYIDGNLADRFNGITSSDLKGSVLTYEKTGLSNTNHIIELRIASQVSMPNCFDFDFIDIDGSGKILDINSQETPNNIKSIVENKTVKLTWDTVAGATSYNVKRSTTAGGPYTTIASNLSTVTYNDSNVTSGATYYYVVSAVTSNGESANSNEVSTTVATSNPTLTSTASANKVKIGDEFTTDIAIHNVTNICAEDIKVSYDANLFEYVGATAQTGLKIYKEDTSTPGIIRFIVACQGKDNVATGDKNLIQLKFKAKARGTGKVDIIKGRIADNATLEMDVADENCGEATIEVGGKDVNRTDSFTLLDLGIDAYYFGFNAVDTDTSKYDADQDANGKIDDTDLSSITQGILNNKDYTPNM